MATHGAGVVRTGTSTVTPPSPPPAGAAHLPQHASRHHSTLLCVSVWKRKG